MKNFHGKQFLVLLEISKIKNNNSFSIPEIIYNINTTNITDVSARIIIDYLRKEEILEEVPTKFGSRRYKLNKEKLNKLLEEQIIYKKMAEYFKINSILIE